jgi:hypothetical protein
MQASEHLPCQMDFGPMYKFTAGVLVAEVGGTAHLAVVAGMLKQL